MAIASSTPPASMTERAIHRGADGVAHHVANVWSAAAVMAVASDGQRTIGILGAIEQHAERQSFQKLGLLCSSRP